MVRNDMNWEAADDIKTFQSTVIAVVPPVGPPIVVPVGRAVRNTGVYLDDRFKVKLHINSIQDTGLYNSRSNYPNL